MTKLLSLPDQYHIGRRVHGFFEDFYEFVTGDLWTKVTAVDGAVTILDAAGGKAAISSAVDTAGNEDCYLKSNKESFKFAAGKPLHFEALVDFIESSTNQANVMAGLMDAVAANSLQNDGAGPKASYSGAVFYKVDGETVWRCESSIGASQVTTQTSVTAGGSTAQRLTIEFQPITSSLGEVRFFIDDALVAKHAITFTSATEMQVVLGVKDGDASDEETLNVDYVACYQLR
jgi:hypothetical protein